ncbi:MAG: Alternative oxidase/tellurite resistance protein TehB [Parcubacteria bacterium C7867-004]|nr:MAG: Alternative oxidase/tellurite resistance protein TehB [Parcubacteria bacterium C7867-004]
MAYTEATSRAYVEERFPRASKGEREKIIQDWLTKPKQSIGIANDFESRIKPVAGLRILDAGSGNGGIGIAFAAKGAIVEGVDIEEELVQIAKDEAAAIGSSASFRYYEGTTLPFPDESFDAALSVSVIEHVTDPVRYFSEILRVTKTGGVLYLAFPNRLSLQETHTGLWGLTYLPLPLARIYARVARHNPIEDNNLHFYTYWNMRRLLGAARAGNRTWSIREEKGRSTNPLMKGAKKALAMFGIPHQALLPHVMLVVEAD